MEKMTWTKLVARNQYPLHTFSQTLAKAEGVKLGKLHWKINQDLLIRFDSPLVQIFGAANYPACNTNIEDYLTTQNIEIENALNEAIAQIKSHLLVAAGDDVATAAKLYRLFKQSMALMIMGYFWIVPIEKLLQESIGEERWSLIRSDVLHPFQQTIIGREHEAIAEAQKKYASDRTLIDILAATLANRFGFVHSEYRAKSWDTANYVEEIKTSIPSNHESVVKSNNDSTDYQNWLIEIAQKIIFIFDEGKSAIVRANWSLRETIKNMGLAEIDVMSCTEKEFIAWTDGSPLPDNSTLAPRDRFHAVLLRDGSITEYLTKVSVELLIKDENITEFDTLQGSIKELKGAIAYKGKVKGKARIVFSQSDAEQFKNGEILVASMTTPELLGAMRKAAAFVTDEGGVTCHAAIVARELKIPCVIATKIATKVLKSGDVVEVDADKGIVKII